MCGRATFAMVVSRTCRSTAIITPMVTISRSPEGKGCVATDAECSSAIERLLLLVLEVDRCGHRQARDHWPGGMAVEDNPYRHALRHLDPVAVGILRRKKRKLAAGP